MQTLIGTEQAMQDDAEAALPIVDLVELVKRIQREGRQITGAEQARLARWMGWGPLAPAFEPGATGQWGEVRTRLQMLLGPAGFEAASAATPTSFFTARFLAATIWQLATRLGFPGGRVLEPGCGSGAILAAAPADLPLQVTGIEREPFAASVARLRHPTARVVTAPFEQMALVNASFDLVVGNVPFSSVTIYDRDSSVSFSLHNYFLWRALTALRPGGLAMLITSHHTLDARDDRQRAELGTLGRLLGALRLPSGAHQAAGTQVVTDLLVLQRHLPDSSWQGQPWMDLSPDIVPGVEINAYFQQCPQHLIGTPVVERGMHRANELRVVAPTNLAQALSEAVENLVEIAWSNGASYVSAPDYTTINDRLVRRRPDGRKEGSYHLQESDLVQIRDGEPQVVTRHVAELSALVRLRTAVLALLEAERDLDRPESELAPLRARLNACYDAYVQTYGPLHRATVITSQPDPETGEQAISRRRPPALAAFSQDPEYAVVLGLEQYDQSTQQASKAQIFRQRVHVRPARKTSADSPGEALALCLDEHGCLKFDVIGRLLFLAETEVPARLGDLVYEDPQSGVWQTAQDYLSGNVRLKLAVAERAAAEQPERFGRNVTALQALVPEDLEPEEIRALLGAPWIPPADLEQFCLETFGARPNIRYEALTASWDLTLPEGVSPSLSATSQWGTRALDAFRLVEIGLNKGVPVVYDTVERTRVRNLEETLLAQDKLRAIQLRFSEWVWEDDARAARLAAVYNRLFRSVVPRVYDGSHLSFPGMDEAWARRLYPWQRDFVWRMVCSRSALCGHPVGAGKTTTQIAGAMTLRRFGLISKAAIVVPNHLVEQITAEAQRLYPGARVLMVTREDLSRERRKLFAARVALGDYDFVVMTHAGLFALRVHPETERAYLEQRIARYRQALLDLDEERDRRHRRSIKRLETAIEQMRQRQRALLDRPADEGVTFEQLGVSYLIVDECHQFKNLGLPTNIAGLQVQPSKRAVDLEMKLRWLEEQNQGRPFASFFSATPLANNMVEAYVQAWYLDQDLLRSSGLCSVDAFASTFIALETRVEVSPNGASFRLHTRPSRFVNMPELMSLLARFADLRGPEILDEKRPQRREHTITIPPDKAVQDYVDDLVMRSEQILQGRPRPMGAGRQDNMLWVTTHGRAAALDLLLVGIASPTAPKLEAVASSMLTVYRRVQRAPMRLDGEFQGLQIGFCDLGTPNQESEQVYGKLKQLLIEGGIPAHGIRYVQEARTEAAKERLFEQCRMGAVAVLLGSTALMGTDTNIQARCVAIHHIDAPWRPDEVEQREGRGHRPGNRYAEVEIYRYVQQRTFDAYSWQTLTTKAVFFDQMRRGQISSREVDELGDTALSYAQVKAAATGDPLVLEQAELEVTLAQLQRLHSAHLRARKREAQEAERARSNADRALARAVALSTLADNVARCARPGFVTPAGELLCEQGATGARIVQQLERLLAGKGGKVVVGQWSGARVVVQVEPWDQEYVACLLIGEEVVRVEVVPGWMRKKQQWRFAAAIEQAITSASADAAREQAAAQRARGQAEQLERQAQQPFPRAQELQARLARKAALDDYTALVAAVKEDPNRREELAARRVQLLQSVPDYALLSAVPQPGLSAGLGGRQVPLFGQARSASVRRSRTRRTSDAAESFGTQLLLFPDLAEREA